MQHPHSSVLGIALAGVLAIGSVSANADTFGLPGFEFAIDFVNIGNAGNADDSAPNGGPYGGVAYDYRIGKFEISQDAISKATASGLSNVSAGPHAGNKPAANMTWFEAAAFVNWLNESTGHQKAYDLNESANALMLWDSGNAWANDPGVGSDLNLYRHKDAFYFLPSEDEWYKAAFHKNDGVTANYWDYATGSDSPPTQELTGGTYPGSAVYNGVEPGRPAGPADVDLAGGLSPYGTAGQDGNVYEWGESAFDGINDSPDENRVIRGGYWNAAEQNLRSSDRVSVAQAGSGAFIGFRVASVGEIVPEPSATLLAGYGLALIALRRRARR